MRTSVNGLFQDMRIFVLLLSASAIGGCAGAGQGAVEGAASGALAGAASGCRCVLAPLARTRGASAHDGARPRARNACRNGSRTGANRWILPRGPEPGRVGHFAEAVHADRLDVLLEVVVGLLVVFLDRPREARRYRIDEHEIGVGQEGLVVDDQFAGVHLEVAFVVERNPFRSEDPEVQPHRG